MGTHTDFTAGQAVYWTDHNGIDREGTFLRMDTATTAVVAASAPMVGDWLIASRFLSAYKSIIQSPHRT